MKGSYRGSTRTFFVIPLLVISLSIVLAGSVNAAYQKSEQKPDQKPEKAPNFTDGQWIDTSAAGEKVPHSIKGYRGHVLLVDFWEFTCINCIRDFSELKRWYRKYHSFGFDIVGVHFDEFEMGYSADNVRDDAKRFQLPWPVVADLQGSIWKAYKSDVWPNRYLIDQKGDIVLHIEGEGNNPSMEKKIRVTNPKKPVRVYLLQDGKPLSQDEAGTDVHLDSQGSYVEISSPRMYYLVKNAAFSSHLLTLEPQAAAFVLHSFTYGNNCQQDFEQM